MGMYTKVNLIIPIKNETEKNVKDILIAMFDGLDVEEMEAKQLEIPKHKLFEDGRRVWFPASGGSYYFTGTVNSKIKYTSDVGENQMVLHIDTDFKNYNDEIKLFLDWICPYIDEEHLYRFLGYYQYEEDTNPTLCFYGKDKILQFTNNNVQGDVS